MRRKKESLILGPLLKKLAARIGAKVLIEPEWGVAGMIIYKNGKHRFFRYNTLDLNPVGASDIAKDKDYAAFFMRKLGYPTVLGKAFFSREWCELIDSKRNIGAAYRYAKRLGFPVIVKPNSGSQGGGVALVHDKTSFYRALNTIFKNDKVALVQRYISARDYRIVVLDSAVISAYERVPLNVTGDGRSTIRQLLRKKVMRFRRKNRDTLINLKDSRIQGKLRRQRLSWVSRPKRGEQIFLLDNANLSSGGDAIDVTDRIHPAFKKLAIRLTRDMGLRMCGVDLMVQGDVADPPGQYHILEINAAPGLDHYVKGGREQVRIVETLYFKVLKSLAR
ncbi:MAG: cyanophycin synthetase [Candidatus Kaiserbacteria bacterium]|nr:cyanophycin synthetase [Candidatus Kaiserbacteria bacterium]